MKRLTALLILCMLLGLDAYAGPPTIINSGSAGILTDSNCDQEKYHQYGILCQATGNGKWYKWNGTAMEEVAAGAGLTAEAVSALPDDASPSSTSTVPTLSEGTLKKTTLGNAITKGHGLADGMLKISSGIMKPAIPGTDYFGDPIAHAPNCVYGHDADNVMGCFDEWTLERIQTGADPAVNATSNVGIDETADQLVYFSGGRAHALTDIMTKEYNLSNPPAIPLVPIVTGTNDVLKLAYDGGAVTDVTIAGGTYVTMASLESAIKSAIDTAFTASSVVTYGSGKLTLDAGEGHTLAYTHAGSTAAAALGFTANIAAARTVQTQNAMTVRKTLFWRVPYPITILQADCIAQGATPAVTVDFQGCATGTGSSCATKGITPVISDANVDVVSPAVTITESSNDILNLAYNGGASTSVTITPGTYTTGAALAANIQSAARSALTAPDLTCTWSTADANITIAVPKGYTISYAYSGSTAAAACGFPTASDISPAQTITGTTAVLAPQTFTTQWMAVDLSSVSGTIDHLSCTLQYVPTRQ